MGVDESLKSTLATKLGNHLQQRTALDRAPVEQTVELSETFADFTGDSSARARRWHVFCVIPRTFLPNASSLCCKKRANASSSNVPELQAYSKESAKVSRDQRSLSVAMEIRANMAAMIQKRVMTLLSAQPLSSKWWWRGAMRNSRLPAPSGPLPLVSLK